LLSLSKTVSHSWAFSRLLLFVVYRTRALPLHYGRLPKDSSSSLLLLVVYHTRVLPLHCGRLPNDSSTSLLFGSRVRHVVSSALRGPFSIVDMLRGSPLSGHLPFVAFFLSGPLSLSLVVFLVWWFSRLLDLHGAYEFMPLCPSIVVGPLTVIHYKSNSKSTPVVAAGIDQSSGSLVCCGLRHSWLPRFVVVVCGDSLLLLVDHSVVWSACCRLLAYLNLCCSRYPCIGDPLL
jgi:hypothetical protein